MPNLRLRKLPDRTPIKMTQRFLPALDGALRDHAAPYGDVYDRSGSVHELVSTMPESFLRADRAFVRRLRSGGGGS